MKYLLFLNVFFLFGIIKVHSQEMKFAGTHPPNELVLELLKRESDIFEKTTNVKERDSLRKQIISKGFFYHGIDGKPIDINGLTKRQTKNGFQLVSSEIMSETLYQYESTAILIVVEKQKVKDKGEIHENINSVLIVMGIENGEWKIQADIMGRKPSLPN